ncbi:HAMP domain-containing sensor histidine kinase [Paenibacillus sp. D2_2]|uniref:sensor histidine kinase n=1 Tax=Paenibacillus sp. D2_2 TaxID=3073092 RepID=UPI00281629D4|nr:HAMP domain-containing sensor histidine kinase [Paenibacillus sp. D2_2]WMT39637.1 HAMP domain-containing sensor histidine kinase [Paenibacillus sp. D2_2]
MFKRLRNKFMILNMTIITVVMISAFAVIYMVTYTNIQKENQNKLTNITTSSLMMNPLSKSAENNSTGRVFVGKIPNDYASSFNVLVGEDNKLLNVHSYLDLTEETYQKATKLATSSKKDSAVISINGQRWLYKMNPMNANLIIYGKTSATKAAVHKQIYFIDVTESYKILSQLLLTFGAISIVMLFVIFGISLFFARRAIKPVEIAYEKQKQFIADASHELKTPIAVINANAEALYANKTESIESQQKWLNYITAETDRMGKLVSDLLYLAKTDSEAVNNELIPFNISHIVTDVLLAMEAVVFEKGITLSHDIEPDLIAYGASEKMKQVVIILLDNAVKYVNENGNIDVALRKSRNHVFFSVKNTGSGIPKESLPKLFDRFYRIDASRAHDGGYGLGLSIARAIIENADGKFTPRALKEKVQPLYLS